MFGAGDFCFMPLRPGNVLAIALEYRLSSTFWGVPRSGQKYQHGLDRCVTFALAVCLILTKIVSSARRMLYHPNSIPEESQHSPREAAFYQRPIQTEPDDLRRKARPTDLSATPSAFRPTARENRTNVTPATSTSMTTAMVPSLPTMPFYAAGLASAAGLPIGNPMVPYPFVVPNQAGLLKSMAVAPYSAINPADLSKVKTPFVNRNYLELAMLVCNTFRGKLFPCSHCRYVTDRRNNLKRHISTMHQACEKVLECCGVSFTTKALLREHIMIFHHNGYSCPFCGRRFCRKALLKRHLTVHSGQKDFTCPHCDYATSHKSNLERHKRIHERLRFGDENIPHSEAVSPDADRSSIKDYGVAYGEMKPLSALTDKDVYRGMQLNSTDPNVLLCSDTSDEDDDVDISEIDVIGDD